MFAVWFQEETGGSLTLLEGVWGEGWCVCVKEREVRTYVLLMFTVDLVDQ